MKAMILAAGLGTRLRPLTDRIPKPLLTVGGTPLIVWNLLLLRRHGVTEVVINLHHLGHLIEESLGNGEKYGLKLAYSREPVILGTGGGLKQAEPFFEGRPFLVLNGDTLLELDLTALMAFHRERDALATMVLRDDPDARRWGAVEVDARHRIRSINGRGGGGQGSEGAAAETVMFAGLHVMHPDLLRDVPAGRESSIIEAYVRAIQQGAPVMGYRMTGYWSDVGTSERYVQTQRDAEAGLISLAGRSG